MSLRRITTFLGVLIVVLGLAPVAGAAPIATSCVFDGGSATVTATIGSGADPVLERSGDAIDFDGAGCGTATVTNTDTIDVTAPDLTTTEGLTISIAGGRFAPGKTAETDGSDEIEMAVTLDLGEPITVQGSAGDDSIWGGAQVIDLGPQGPADYDVWRNGTGALGPINILGGDGDDHLSLVRPPGWGVGWWGSIDGGSGDDLIDGSPYLGSTYDGGPGHDVLSYPNAVFGVSISTSSGGATVARSTNVDTVTGVEVYRGSDLDDTFHGGDVSNVFYGGPGADLMYGGAMDDQMWGENGNDTFIPQGGSDTIDGGSGWDAFVPTGAGPEVFHLDTRTAIGDGTDTYADVEGLRGMAFDDRFVGRPTPELQALDGGDGHDVLDLRSSPVKQHVTGIPLFPSFGGSIPTPGFYIFDLEVAFGSSHADRFDVLGMLSNSFQDERYQGGGGNDVLVGGPGADQLLGGPGNDRLVGAAGKDVLNGGPGRDTCTGGSRVDTVAHCELG